MSLIDWRTRSEVVELKTDICTNNTTSSDTIQQCVAGTDLLLSKKTGDTELTLDGLETFTSYYVKVAAYTKQGSGVRSDKVICTTAQDGESENISSE